METTAKHSKKWMILEISLMIGLAVFLFWGALSLQAQQELAGKVVRLHVLANSDSEEDQALKLLVRDRVLAQAQAFLEQSEGRDQAEELLRRQLPALEKAAALEIAAQGYGYPVTAELTETRFPTREYDGFSLPAGRYLALRIVIGQGSGQNWWCVVFPPLCTAASAGLPASAGGLSEEDVRLIQESDAGYVLKFKSIEWWEGVKERFS